MRLFAQHFYDQPLAALPVELGVENFLPGAEIQFALGNRYDDLVMKQDALQVSVCVGLAGLVMPVVRTIRSQCLSPLHEIRFDAWFFIVDKDTCGDVHCRYQGHSFFYSRLSNRIGDQACNVNELSFVLRVEPVVGGV